VNLSTDVEWIAPCSEMKDDHLYVSVYLLRDGSDYVLVDTGSIVHRDQIEERIEEVTDERGPDTILLTHTDYPHTGNLSWMLSKWPEVDIYVGTSNPAGQNLPERTRQSKTGERQTIGSRGFHFIDPPLADRSLTNWIFDEESGVLFTADGFGYLHTTDTCGATSRDLSEDLSTQRIYEYHRVSLPWLRYVDPPLLRLALDAILDRHEVQWLAPSHGPPVEKRDIEQYMMGFEDAVERIANEYDPR
jgi:flavorubredoxin